MTTASLSINKDSRGVVTLGIHRAEIHNAFDDELIEQLISALDQIAADPQARVLILRSDGKSFSAGADLGWMRRMADYTPEQNKADARQLASMMHKLNTLNIPTIARVQGAAFGGGVGLLACCDIAIGSDNAVFCLSEVRLGLVPAVISPYVVAAIGERNSRRYFMSAERFNAEQALRIHLLHEMVEHHKLDEAVDSQVNNLLKGGSNALSCAKALIFTVSAHSISQELIDKTVDCIADVRASDEGKEGLNAFLDKRSPDWLTV